MPWGGGSAAGGSLSSYTVSVTPANSDKVLYAFINRGDTTAPSSVVFNTSENLSLIASGTYNGAANGWWLYRLINPTSVTANVVSTWGASANGGMAAFWYHDLLVSAPNGVDDEAEGSSTTPQNTLTSAVGEIGIGMVATTGTSTKAPASGETERIDASTSSPGLYELAGAASLSFDITLGTSRPWVLVCISLVPMYRKNTANVNQAVKRAATI